MIKAEYLVREYSNGAEEIVRCSCMECAKLDPSFVTRKVTYNTGDVVYFLGQQVVSIIPYDTGIRWPNCENPDTSELDFSRAKKTNEAELYHKKLKIAKDLDKDPHCYDDYVKTFLKDDSIKITEEIVRRFFDLPMPSRDVKLSARRSGTSGFDVHVYVTLNPAIQDTAMQQLNALLDAEAKSEWLEKVYPWATSYTNGISYRHFSGSVKEAQTLIQKWFKNCEQKIGKKNLTTESLMQI